MTALLMAENLSRSVWKPDMYTKSQDKLDVAIREYDQAIIHLTARIVASKISRFRKLIAETNYWQQPHTRGELLQWLCPSYWIVESYLHSFRHQRAQGTLSWARDMPEFRDWRLSDLDKESPNRITWIHATLGVGKSIMAAYFIDLLKCQYPNAIVAYFFCRSKEAGVFTARDILRALAYQCTEKVSVANAAIKELKSHGFQISDDLGIGYLFKMLLLGPMQTNNKDIFLVLDGLDEADTESQDLSGKPELHVLLNALSELPFTRLLCVSRPSADISKVLPRAFNKPLRREDTQADIDSYVTNTITESSTLEMLFRETRKDPLAYFREKGSGIFLWVVLVLQQLEKSTTRSAFLRCLEGFSEATGSMDKLYFAILSKVAHDDKRLVKEILRWVVFSPRFFSTQELKDIVEKCLDERFVDFQRFFDTKCGSFVSHRGDFPIHIVHETFRSFLLNPKKCQPEFLLDEPRTHGYVVLKCFQFLSEGPPACASARRYASDHWVYHLARAKSPRQRAILLGALSRFFASEGLVVWVCDLCTSSRPSFGVTRISFEEQFVKDIKNWLREKDFEEDCSNAEDVEARNRLCGEHNGNFIGQEIGKMACFLWASGHVDDCDTLENGFGLALKQYRKRSGRTQTNLEELQELISTRFTSLLNWSGRLGDHGITNKSLGLAFHAECDWNNCILGWETEALSTGFLVRQGFALIHEQAYKRAVRCLISILNKRPHSFTLGLDDLFQVLLQVGDGKGFLDPLLQYILATSNFSYRDWYWDELEHALLKWGDSDTVILVLENFAAQELTSRGYWHSFYRAYKRGRGSGLAIRRLQEIAHANPQNRHILGLLAKAYMDQGNHDQALEMVRAVNPGGFGILNLESEAQVEGNMIEDLIINYPNSNYYYGRLSQIYRDAGNFDQSIKILVKARRSGLGRSQYLYNTLLYTYKLAGQYLKAIELFKDCQNQPAWFKWDRSSLTILAEVYELMGKHDEGVQMFESILSTFSEACQVWPSLLMAMSRSGFGDDAISRFEKAIDEGHLQWSAELAHTMLEIYKSKGDYDRAIQRFETLVHLQPLAPWSWSWHVLADINYASGQETAAFDVYRRALEINKAEPTVYYRLCSMYYGASDYWNVVQCYDIVMQRCRKSVLWEYVMIDGVIGLPGSVGVHNTNIDTSINYTLLSLFLWYPVAKSYEALGLHEEAIAVYQEVLTQYESIKEDDSNSIITIYSEYRLWPHKLMKRRLPQPVLWYLIGELNRALKQFERSLKAFEKALAVIPNNSWLQTVMNQTQCESEVYDANTTDDLDSNDKAQPIEASERLPIDTTL